MSKKRIAVLAGGWSQERAVSLKSGETVCRALNRDRYDVRMYDPRDDLQALMDERDSIDLAVIVLHGKFGEDGRIQGLLDILGIGFVGSGVLSSAMALNKRVAKEVFRNRGLRVPKDMMLRKGEGFSLSRVMAVVGTETVVKPVAEGSSLGVSVCRGREELLAGIQKGFEYDAEVIVEEFIQGTEVTCCVLGAQELKTLPLVEIAPKNGYRFFDYEAKYRAGATEEICPARISQAVAEEVRAFAKTAHRGLGCRVWSRTDMMIRGEKAYVLETNTVPGMTENSLSPLAARAAGLSVSDLLDKLIGLSLDPEGGVSRTP